MADNLVVFGQTFNDVSGFKVQNTNGDIVTFSSGGGTVNDVQINGTSIVNQGVANVPIADTNTLGLV